MADELQLDKIIIISECELWWKDTLKTVALHMIGMKVEDVLYLNDQNSIADEDELQEDLLNELYDDCYDDDDVIIDTKEVYNGEHAMMELADFIYDNWNQETMVLFYEPKSDAFDKLKYELRDRDGEIYLSDYHDIFKDKRDTEKDIYEIMETVGIKVSHMIKDSYMSKAYFLGALVDRLNSR